MVVIQIVCKICGGEEFYEFNFSGTKLLECLNCGARHNEKGELME